MAYLRDHAEVTAASIGALIDEMHLSNVWVGAFSSVSQNEYPLSIRESLKSPD
jgi:hypothetical protein